MEVLRDHETREDPPTHLLLGAGTGTINVLTRIKKKPMLAAGKSISRSILNGCPPIPDVESLDKSERPIDIGR